LFRDAQGHQSTSDRDGSFFTFLEFEENFVVDGSALVNASKLTSVIGWL